MSHTYATLPVTEATYNEIQEKLIDAGYDEQIEEGVIDMHGLALLKEREETELL